MTWRVVREEKFPFRMLSRRMESVRRRVFRRGLVGG